MPCLAARVSSLAAGPLGWRVAPIPGNFQTTNEGAPGPSSAAAEGPGMPQTSTRNLFAMLPVNPLEPPSRTRTDASARFGRMTADAEVLAAETRVLDFYNQA